MFQNFNKRYIFLGKKCYRLRRSKQAPDSCLIQGNVFPDKSKAILHICEKVESRLYQENSDNAYLTFAISNVLKADHIVRFFSNCDCIFIAMIKWVRVNFSVYMERIRQWQKIPYSPLVSVNKITTYECIDVTMLSSTVRFFGHFSIGCQMLPQNGTFQPWCLHQCLI